MPRRADVPHRPRAGPAGHRPGHRAGRAGVAFGAQRGRAGDAAGLLGDWPTALEAFTTRWYRNRLGVTARADRLDELAALLTKHQLPIHAWYGVRVFTDTAANDTAAPTGEHLEALLACEEQAGHTDPYRQVAPLLHIMARRS